MDSGVLAPGIVEVVVTNAVCTVGGHHSAGMHRTLSVAEDQ